MSRENVVFELELKEYNPGMFEELKEFASRPRYTPEEVEK
jgi:predicted Zn-dependent peptidase